MSVPGSSDTRLLERLERWIPTAVLADRAALRKALAEREQFRIEADEAMRDYDALELEHGILKEKYEALQRLRAPRDRHDYSGMGF